MASYRILFQGKFSDAWHKDVPDLAGHFGVFADVGPNPLVEHHADDPCHAERQANAEDRAGEPCSALGLSFRISEMYSVGTS